MILRPLPDTLASTLPGTPPGTPPRGGAEVSSPPSSTRQPHTPRMSYLSEPPVWLSLGHGKAWQAVAKGKRETPVLASAVRAGFPSPAEDYIEGSLDLNRHLIRHPAATFIVRVEGESMTGAGIFPGDLLVVDRSLEPHDGHVVIAIVEGELTVKRLKGRAGAWRLVAEHPDFVPILMPSLEDGGETSAIWGVVTNAVRNLMTG